MLWIELLNYRRRVFCRTWLTISCCLLVSPFSSSALSEIRFQEVTGSAGIAYTGQSYGAAWGDFDGDGLADLWVNNHLARPDLYHNNGDGTFTDILLDVWSGNPRDDTHGPTWGDFDNDGDQDLIELVGAQGGVGQGPNHLYLNQDGVLIDMATTLGVDYPVARGRTASWLDWNNDGLLDLLLSSRRRPDGQAPSALFEQIAGSFQNASDTASFAATASSNVAQLADVTGDGILDLLVHGVDYPQRVYDMTQQPFVDISSALGLLPKATNVWDAAVADLNGDLRTDLFLTRVVDGRQASDVFQENGTSIKARLRSIRNGEEKGIRFRSAGDVLFDLYSPPASNIFIGTSGQNPAETPFTLSASDPSVWGIKPHVAGTDPGNYIGYDPATQVWQWLASSPGRIAINGIIQTVAPATELSAIGFDPASLPLNDRLLIQTASGFIDQTSAAGLNVPTSCYAVAAGDLDNDMDVDLYLVCNRPTANLPNILYENLGNGDFVAVANAGGAAGSTLGRGENVVLADYDGDGFLDLFVTNGLYTEPFNEGPQQLFRNEGNANHWIEIDLEGSVSNRDGIGAQIRVTAGGVTQLRERDGGVHRHAQNHQRIHFGLGSNTAVDMIEVRWPSGVVQTVTNVSVDQILSIQELPVTIGIEDIVVDERTGILAFQVSLSAPGSKQVSVDYSTVDQSAVAGQDYVGVSGQLTFLPGETRKAIQLELIRDNLDEADETFLVELSNAMGAMLVQNQANVVITMLPVWFDDVTESAGIDYSLQGLGASWGDFNGDGCPDLWTGNHYEAPSLYINSCGGVFVDIAPSIVDWVPSEDDSHGAAWGDFDADGDQDLIEVSGWQYNFLYVNEAGGLIDRAEALGVRGCAQSDSSCRNDWARAPLWLDWNRDGALDLLTANAGGGAPPALYQQQDGVFIEVGASVGLVGESDSDFAQLGDLSSDGWLDLILDDSIYPNEIYGLGGPLLLDLSNELQIPAYGQVRDVVMADFDGDLKTDMFLARGKEGQSDVLQVDNRVVNVHLAVGKGNERGLKFKSQGIISFEMLPFRTSDDVFVGASGFHPDGFEFTRKGFSFTLNPGDPATWGLSTYNGGQEDGVFIGYDTQAGEWTLMMSTSAIPNPIGYIGVVIRSTTAITAWSTINFQPFASGKPNRLLRNDGTVFTEIGNQAGFASVENCFTVGGGDFDNDMDVDLYVGCARPAGNTENLLYLNDGQGTFEKVLQAGGAQGTIFGFSYSVALADYDRDGFLDILVNNSHGSRGFVGPTQLFHNDGNENHWLEIDLEGIPSNRDGIGARVAVETRDGKTQIREQAGGVHGSMAQDHQRLHVGLGGNTRVEALVINWPSGIMQRIEKINADQVIRVIEQVDPELTGRPDMSSAEGGVYLWRDSDSGPYRLRVKSNNQSTFVVKLVSAEALSSVDPFKLESNDELTVTAYGFSLRSIVNGGGQDGVDFSLPAGTRALLSVERGGIANPRQLHVGASGAPLSPVGWIKPLQEWPLRPAFVEGQDLGLFAGRGTGAGEMEMHWNGDGPRRAAGVSLISSHALVSVTPIKLERDDALRQTESSAEVDGHLGPKIDAVDVLLDPASDVGLAYRQDNLVAPYQVNKGSGGVGVPNAYWLPLSGP